MTIRKPIRLLVACAIYLVTVSPGSAAPQLSSPSVADVAVTVAVHNPDSQPITLRVQVGVRLVDDSTETLTSGNVVVAAGGTAQVTLVADAPVSEIADDPEPINP